MHFACAYSRWLYVILTFASFIPQFVKQEHAEQIFVSEMEKVCSGKNPVPETTQLFGSLVSKCSRPNESGKFCKFCKFLNILF